MIYLARCAAGELSPKEDGVVDDPSLAAGVRLSRWFGREARRIHELLAKVKKAG